MKKRIGQKKRGATAWDLVKLNEFLKLQELVRKLSSDQGGSKEKGGTSQPEEGEPRTRQRKFKKTARQAPCAKDEKPDQCLCQRKRSNSSTK